MNKISRRALAAATALTLGTGFALGTASAAQAVDTWTITSLTLDNPIVVDTNTEAGDDGGLLSVTESYVLRNGNNTVFAFDLATLDPFAATDADPGSDYMYVSDLKTSTAYQIFSESRGPVSELVQLDNEGNVTTTVITLSESIEVSGDSWYLISGYGWIGMWEFDRGLLKVINPATGTVTTNDANLRTAFTPATLIADEDLGAWDGGGVGMYDGTDYWFVGSDVNGDISQFKITGTAQTSVLLVNEMASSPDSDTFMVSAIEGRFYIHDESPGDLYFGQNTTGMSEAVLSADATFSLQSGDAPAPPAPTLPETGVDAGTTTAVAVGLAVLGALAIILVRRRRANVG